MKIRNGDGDGRYTEPYDPDAIVFVLSREEAERVIIDHDEGVLLLPCADTLAGTMAMGAALRGELTDAGYVIDPLPD